MIRIRVRRATPKRPDPSRAEAAEYDPPPPIKGRPVDESPFPRYGWRSLFRRTKRGRK